MAQGTGMGNRTKRERATYVYAARCKLTDRVTTMFGFIDDTTLDDIVRTTDWAVELQEAIARYSATPSWRFLRRRIHLEAVHSALGFLEQQEAGRL
jgi:hypothetical protein